MSVSGNKQELDAKSENNGGAIANRATDAALCVWFVLCAVAFWGPYAGLSLPFNILTALYAVFLLGFIATAALRVLRSREQAAPQTAKAAPAPQGKRRG